MTLLQIYALTAIILGLKMSAISVVQALSRTRSGVFVNPEDARTFGTTASAQENETVQRAARAWRNDLENIPIFLILGWIYVSAGLSTTAFTAYCVIFVIARIAHTILYLNAVQPLRTAAYAIGSGAILAMMIHLFVRVVLA